MSTRKVTWSVIVGNIGTVYSGSSRETAIQHYTEYVDQSKREYGRAAGEDVIMTRDDEPVREYTGRIAREQAAAEDAEQRQQDAEADAEEHGTIDPETGGRLR